MSGKVIFSVIINSYNYGIFIEEAITSVLNQSFHKEDVELIVVDDGSTDDTRERVAKYPEVNYCYKENGGQASAINAGLAVTRGRFVAFLDADDRWYPNKLETLLATFNDDASIDVIYHTMDLVNTESGYSDVIPHWYGLKSHISILNNRKHLTTFGSPTSAIAWRTATLRALLPIPEEYRLCADGYLNASASLVAKKIALIDQPLAFYRLHNANNYTEFDDKTGSYFAKSHDAELNYRTLLHHHLVQLANRLGCVDSDIVKELQLICVRDETIHIQKQYGIIRAILFLLKERRLYLSGISIKYRAFRFVVIMLQIILSPPIFIKLQNIYSKSYLLPLVQSHIKNDENYLELSRLRS